MQNGKPAFDPNKPYSVVEDVTISDNSPKPKFDPNKPYSVVEEPITKKGFSPYEGIEITPLPPKPTTFWQEVGRQLYSEPDPNNPTIAYKLIHPLVEGVKQGAKDIGDAAPNFLDSPLNSSLKTVKGVGEIAFNIIPAAVGFSIATNAIKMAADKTPYGKEIGEVIDIPFTLASKVAHLAGYDPEKDSNGELALGILDIIAGGKVAHETMSKTKSGKLKDLSGDVVKDKSGKAIQIEVPTVAGKAIKTFKDLTGVTEKAAKGELSPEQMKELSDYLEGLKNITPNDIIKSAENKVPEIVNVDEASARLNADQMSDKQKSDLLTDVVKGGNSELFKQRLQKLKDEGSLTKEQADEGFIRLNSYDKYINHLKDKGLDDASAKEATHKAWQLENDDFNIKAIENDPTHTEDPMKQADLVNLRNAKNIKVKELADILAKNKVEKEVESKKSSVVFESEQEFLDKNWKDVRDELELKLKRDPTDKEVFDETRKLYKEKNPIEEPKIISDANELENSFMDRISAEEKLKFEEFQKSELEKSLESDSPIVKEEVKTEEVKIDPTTVEKVDVVEKEKLSPEQERQKKLQEMPNDEFVDHFIDSGQLSSINDIGTRVTFSNDYRFEPMQPKEISDALKARSKGKETAGVKRLERNILKAKELGIIPTLEGTGGKTKAVDMDLQELMDVKKKVSAKEFNEYNETLLKEREQAEKDILKEEHIPKSEEKGFNSKFEQLIAKKNRTKTETSEGDATETGTFRLGEDIGYVEFNDGTKINIATDPNKTGVAIGFGRKLPKDGSKVIVEAKVADAERQYDRIKVKGFDENGNQRTGYLRKTNKSSNILEATGEKNNPGAYADPLKVGLTEKEQQDILEKEAKGLLGDLPQQQKISVESKGILIKEVVNRLQKALPKLEVVYDEKIEGAGQLDSNGKTVRINPFKAGLDTPIHEYAHALIDIYGGIKNKLVNGAIERLKTTDLWKETEKKYPELSEEMLAKEVLAEAIGREGKEIFKKESQQNWFKNFIDNFFYKIKTKLGLEKSEVKILAKQLLSGDKISDKVSSSIEIRLQKLSEDEMFKKFAEVYKKKSKFEKFKDRSTDILNVPRSLITSMDMSAPMRQAVVYTLTKPLTAYKAGKEMFRQAFSEKNSINWMLDLRNKREYEIMKDSDLFISDPHASKLTNKEEHFMTNLAQKIPVIGSMIKGSERAYAAYLNKMRTDIFVNQIHAFEKKGLTFENSPELYKASADVINHFTGRGHLGSLEKSAQILNTAFFSPRLIASRFQMLNPAWYSKQPKLVRNQAIKDFAQFVATGSAILALAAASGAKVELDPRSSDFGKIQIGKTRLDIWGGFQQWVRTFAQVVSGTKITASGKRIDLDKGRASRLDIIGSFARGKIAPIPALAMEILQGRKVTGEKLKASEVLLDNTIPLYIQDMIEASKQEGGAGILSVGIPAFFGVGTQTYNTNKK